MTYSKFKETINIEISNLIALLISIKTKQTSPFQNDHWTNFFIDELSKIKYDVLDNQKDCESCSGEGADYPPYAESIYDAVACPVCEGYGFLGRKDLSATLHNLKASSAENNEASVVSKLENLLQDPLFK